MTTVPGVETYADPADLVALGEIKLNGVRCKLASGANQVQFSDLARFQQRFLFGDPSKNSNDLLSSWQMGNFAGGHGVAVLKEGTHEGRFSFGTIYGRYPSMNTKPLFFLDQAGLGAGDKRILGEFWGVNVDEFVLVYTQGLQIRRAIIDGNETDHPFDGTYASSNAGTLTSAPVNKGTAFQGTAAEEKFLIPQGNNGYAYIGDTSVAPTEFAAPEFRGFTVFDNKCIGVTTGGRMYYSLDGSTWTAYDLTYQLGKSYRIRHIVTHVDRQDEPCVFIITDRDMWQFDPDGPELFRIDHEWPSHAHHGKAVAVWRGSLYIAVGMAVWRYASGTFMPVGLDRDYGLPSEYLGYINDFAIGTNGLYAQVQAIDGDSVYGGISSIHEFNSSGWQTVWTQDSAVPSSIQYHASLNNTPYTMNWMHVTGSDGVQTLIFATGGSDDKIYNAPLTMENANPVAGVRRGQLFGSGAYYYLETGEFDADMLGYTQIGNVIQYYLEEPLDVTPSMRDTFRICAQFDRGDWELIASTEAAPGRYAKAFGDALEEGLYSGEPFERINLRYEILRAASYNEDKPMLWTNAVLSFLKTVASNPSFQLAIDCTDGSADGTMNHDEFEHFIDDLTSIHQFVLLTVGHHTYRVYVSQNGGSKATGDSQHEIRNLAIVAIPTSL
jgi:hypothetical protein